MSVLGTASETSQESGSGHQRQEVSTGRTQRKSLGRPTKLTPELAQRVYEYLKAGASFTATCRVVGISKEVFRRWRLPCADAASDHEHGRACRHVIERLECRDGQLLGTGEFVAFVALVEQALGEHEARLASLITQAAEKDWRAALEVLRRRYPESWNLPVVPQESARTEPDIDLARERLSERVRQARKRLEEIGVTSSS